MNPDDQGSRLARLEQRVSDLDVRVGQMMPVTNQVAVLSERVGTVRTNVETLTKDFENFIARIDERDAETRKDRQTVKLAIWAMTVTLICALIGAASVILTSIPHG